MHNLDRKREAAAPLRLPCEDVIASVAKDFTALSDILARLNAQRMNLDPQQLDYLIRANAAAARGIELSNRLSEDRS